MGVMDWFKRGAGDNTTLKEPAPPSAEKATAVGGLDFGSAVTAHIKWRQRLESYIDGSSSEVLKADVVCRDDQCPLGKWIYSHGQKHFGYLETFVEMKAHHARFHDCAGEVISAAQAGRTEDARSLLTRGDYVRSSERVKLTLARLFVLVADGKAAENAHLRWKTLLRDFVEGRSRENLQAETVARDDACALGQWLNGAGREGYGQRPIFGVVKERHAQVHRCAGEIVATVLEGNRAAALKMLDEGEYAKASAELVALLRALFEPA